MHNLYAILSVACYSLVHIFVKKMPNIPFYEIILFRGLFTLLACLYFIRKLELKIWGKHKKLLWSRGLFGTIGMTCFFYNLQNIPLASAVTFQYVAPIFTIIISAIWLREQANRHQILAILLCFLGAIMIKGFDSRISIFDFAIGILGALAAGFSYNCIRQLKEKESPYVVMFYFPLVSTPLYAPITINNWVQPSSIEWLYILGLSIFVFLGQYFMTISFQGSKLAAVVSSKYLSIVFALFIGYSMFGESIPLLALSGIVLILVSQILQLQKDKTKLKSPRTTIL